MKYRAYLILILLFVLSCHSGGYKDCIVKTIQFDIGFRYLPKNCGTFTDKSDGAEYVYFGDVVSKKCIKIFDLDAHLKHRIFIDKEACHFLQNIDGVSVISPDTIILNSNYTNKICFINRQGKCWRKINMEGRLMDTAGNVYEMAKSIQKVVPQSHCLIFGLDYRFNINNLDDTAYECRDAVRKYNYMSRQSAYYVKIDPFATTPKLTFCLYGFYKAFTDTGTSVPELVYIYSDKQTFVSSNYSPFIYQLDTKGSKIEYQYLITSSLTPLNFVPYNYDKDTTISEQDYLDQNARYRGIICRLLINKNNNKVVLVLHDIKTRMEPRPFSAIICNNKFEKLKEIPFVDGKYTASYSISTQKGILMRKNNTKTNVNEATEFSLFEFR